MSANFNYYLNRQGPRGRQGEQGEEGFSPVISVKQDDATTYKLLVQNKDGYFETPNLKANQLQITQGGGTYVMYDPESNTIYNALKPSELVDTSMLASTSSAGIIAIADDQDLEDNATDVAVTPAQLNDAVDSVATQIPTNYVTTNTSQAVTGDKNFTGTLLYNDDEVATLSDIPDVSEFVTDVDYATTFTGGVVKVDGSTITIDNDGVISAASSAPDNMVTTDTTQTISGNKTFSGFWNTFQRGFEVTGGSLIRFNQALSNEGANSSTSLSICHRIGDPGLMVTVPNGGTYYKVINSNDFDGTTIVYNNGVISAVAQTPSVIDGGEEA